MTDIQAFGALGVAVIAGITLFVMAVERKLPFQKRREVLEKILDRIQHYRGDLAIQDARLIVQQHQINALALHLGVKLTSVVPHYIAEEIKE